MTLCSTTKGTRAPIRPAHPHGPCWPRLFDFATVAASDPGRVSNFPLDPDDLRLGTSHRTPIRQCHVPRGRAQCSPLPTSLLLCKPLLTLPPSSVQIPSPAAARPGLSSANVSSPGRNPPPLGSPRPGRRCRRQSGSSFPTMMPLGSITSWKPPGVWSGVAVDWPKTSLSHLVNSDRPLSSSFPWRHALPNIRSYTRARGS